MKIISGSLRGRKLEGHDIDGTRPTMDRVKESLFALIQSYINNSIILDLFAGSGSLGIEAISNGASYCYFNDSNKKCIKILSNNISKLGISDSAQVINKDYLECLKYLNNSSIKLDIIFLDPPYKMDCLNEVISYIIDNNMLKDNGIIVCEIGELYLNHFEELELIKNRKYSDKYILIFKKNK